MNRGFARRTESRTSGGRCVVSLPEFGDGVDDATPDLVLLVEEEEAPVVVVVVVAVEGALRLEAASAKSTNCLTRYGGNAS